MVRKLLFLLLIEFWVPCNALDMIDSYALGSIDPKYSWKYGISTASKTIDNETHFALEVNEKLLCSVNEIGLVLWHDQSEGKYLATKFLAGAYVAKVNLDIYEKVTFSISCKRHSTIHKYKNYELKVWSKDS